jgi:two-component SAPR family response regulator
MDKGYSYVSTIINKIRIPVIPFSLLVISFICLTSTVSAQTYGLGFYSHEVSKDLRTGLNLNPGRPFVFNDDFELSFNFGLRPNSSGYFGYIFRIITEDNLNIDLIFNYNSNTNSFLTLVAGQKLIMNLPADFIKLCKGWTEYKVQFNLQKGQISFSTPDTVVTEENIGLDKSENVKIYFGASDIRNFRTTDIPAMNIRDIKILQKGKIRHSWSLNETEGISAKDEISKEKAVIHNPLWIKSNHTIWQSVFQTELDGIAQVAYNPENENIILIGENKLIRYDLATLLSSEFTTKGKNNNLLQGRQAIYGKSNHLYSYDIDYASIAVLNLDSLIWRQKNIQRDFTWTIFGHHNKYFSPAENSVYIFGGYGQHEYKNKVQIFDLNTNTLKPVDVSGDNFYPRYLSALGEFNDTIYILGGYGSKSGAQILNPQTYYDLLAFSLKNHNFCKKFDFKSPLEDLAFANSMVFDPEDRSYYALVFPIFKYEGYLQLIKGSLNNPDFKLMGNTIPYLFYDANSFADLFFCERSRKLVAATIISENNKSKIHLYSLDFPPNQQSQKSLAKKASEFTKSLLLILLIALCGVIVFIVLRKRLIKRSDTSRDKEISDKNLKNTVYDNSEKTEPYSIIFFGDFKVYDQSGKDITRKFTRLLKELFLLIWLHSLKNDTGISTEKIIEILWFNYTESSAHNNKAVNISKLRNILHEIGNCELSNRTGYWKIEFDDKVLRNDYADFLKIVKSKAELSKEKIQDLINITQKGTFLSNLNYDWLDEFKASIANDTIDHLIHSSTHMEIVKEPEFMNHIADAILKFDSVNEEAMVMKCKALIVLGRHTTASEAYSKFAREYKILYGSDFEKSFNEISGL